LKKEDGRKDKYLDRQYEIGNRQSPIHSLPAKNHPKISKNHPLDDTQRGPVWFKLPYLE
jgi:hypothetical protein